MEAFFFKGIWMTQLLKSEIITKFPEEGTWDLSTKSKDGW